MASKMLEVCWYIQGVFAWDQPEIRIFGIMRVSVCLQGAILFPEYLDFHSGYSSPRSRVAGIYSGRSEIEDVFVKRALDGKFVSNHHEYIGIIKNFGMFF